MENLSLTLQPTFKAGIVGTRSRKFGQFEKGHVVSLDDQEDCLHQVFLPWSCLSGGNSGGSRDGLFGRLGRLGRNEGPLRGGGLCWNKSLGRNSWDEEGWKDGWGVRNGSEVGANPSIEDFHFLKEGDEVGINRFHLGWSRDDGNEEGVFLFPSRAGWSVEDPSKNHEH